MICGIIHFNFSCFAHWQQVTAWDLRNWGVCYQYGAASLAKAVGVCLTKVHNLIGLFIYLNYKFHLERIPCLVFYYGQGIFVLICLCFPVILFKFIVACTPSNLKRLLGRDIHYKFMIQPLLIVCKIHCCMCSLWLLYKIHFILLLQYFLQTWIQLFRLFFLSAFPAVDGFKNLIKFSSQIEHQ